MAKGRRRTQSTKASPTSETLGAFAPSEMTGGIHVPARFGNRIASHLILNLLNPPGLTVPLMLGIHGPAGEGKTLQCRRVFEAMGAEAIWPPAEAFESGTAGVAQLALLESYEQAGEANAQLEEAWRRGKNRPNGPCLQVLLINDLDQRIGRKDGAIQQTINTQLISASLMELADNPGWVSTKPTHRVPIVVTANDLASIHSPLYRDGRMRRFEWRPTAAERAEVLASLFPEAELDAKKAKRLMQVAGCSFETTSESDAMEPSTATFAAIKLILYEEKAIELIAHYGVGEVLAAIRRGEVDGTNLQPDLSFKGLAAALDELRQSHHLSDHLAA
jgi:hypothetical protein